MRRLSVMRLFVFSPLVTHPAGTRLAAIRLTLMTSPTLRALCLLAVVAHADAAIVGSALVRRVGGAQDAAGETERFLAELSAGLSVAADA